jgi:lysophospholipase L1-like esterase
MMSTLRNQTLDVIGKSAKAIAIVLTGLTLLVLLAMRASNNINASEYAGLPRYREADAQLASVNSANRVVFFGDSITDWWDLQKSFPGQSYVNRGILGQTTSQMVLRFHQDVVDLKPSFVVILAGINDLGAGVPVGQIESNYAAMAEMARENHIVVLFGSVLPVGKSRNLYPLPKIAALNTWMRDYCRSNGAVYVDYWSRMAEGSGFLLPNLSHDGLHPNADGYAIMQSVLAEFLHPESAAAVKSEKRK